MILEFMKCYLCGASTRAFIDKNGYTVFRCDACRLGQIYLDKNYDDFVKSHYSKDYYMGGIEESAYSDYKDEKKYIRLNFRKFLRKILAYKKSGKLLDVGCAMGYFVEMATEAGFDAYGVDASAYAIAEAKNHIPESKLQAATISDLDFPEKSFDVITMFDVFEHLNDPKNDLKKLRSLLKDDGILVIATGDANSLAATLLRRRWTFYIPPEHIFYFDRNNLSSLLEEVGFVPKLWFRIGKWLSLKYVLHLARTTGESKVANLLYKVLSPIASLPLYLYLGDNMATVATKKLHVNSK